MRFFGVDGECWLVQDPPLEFSIIARAHLASGDLTADQQSLDLTVLGSREVSERPESYTGLDFGFKKLSDVDFSYKTIHLVPGIEHRVREDLDFVGEFGIGHDDDSWHYPSGALAIHFRWEQHGRRTAHLCVVRRLCARKTRGEPSPSLATPH